MSRIVRRAAAVEPEPEAAPEQGATVTSHLARGGYVYRPKVGDAVTVQGVDGACWIIEVPQPTLVRQPQTVEVHNTVSELWVEVYEDDVVVRVRSTYGEEFDARPVDLTQGAEVYERVEG